MKKATRFLLSPSWQVLLNDMQIDVQDALTYAQLPADLFHQKNPSLSPADYFRLWRGVQQAAGDREVPLLLAEHLSVESFDAPIFACICSPNLNVALKRLQHYKPLIGPILLTIDQTSKYTQLTIECYGYEGEIPAHMGLGELVFFTQLSRLATRHRVMPLSIELPDPPENIAAYEAYFSCKVRAGKKMSIRFSAEDAARQFLTSNATMWEFFESKLNKKLADLNATATMVERVRAVLLEALPSGESSIEYVAGKLAMSKRTLQRKLTTEAESFQSVLQGVRTQLADHYLEKSQMSLGEISFLLGFQEANSFIRAYSNWKGVSPGYYRESFH